jgi:hypothetical protein
MLAVDITSQAEYNIKNLLDVKNKLHTEKQSLDQATEECKEQIG